MVKLKDFSTYLRTQIEFIHVVKPNDDNHPVSSSKTSFEGLGQIHQISNEEVVDGIFQFLKANEPAILALYLPTRGFIGDLLHKSVSKQITFQIDRPILGFC